jgi:hypothetical protein
VRNLHGLEKFFAAGTPDYMLNLRGLLTRAAPMLSANAVYTLSCTAWLAAIGLLASALARGRRTGESHLDRDFARTTAVALLFCPHLFLQDAVLWTVPLVLYVAAAPADAKAAAGLACVLVLFPLVFAAAQAVDVWTANRLVVNPVVLLTVALWLVCERSVRLPVDPLRCEADALP